METRNKKGKFVKGSQYWLGKKRPPFSKEWLGNISLSQIGRKHTEETKEKIRKANIGRIFSQETKKKMSVAKKGKKWEERYGIEKAKELKMKVSENFKQLWKQQWYKEKIVKNITGRKYPKELYPNYGLRGKHISEETKKKIGKANSGEKNGMKNPEVYKRVLAKSQRKPNDAEKRYINILKNNNFPYEFVGNFSFWIGPCMSGKCRNPDFVNKNHKIKKAILVDGGWHTKESIEEENNDYLNMGWKVLRFPHKTKQEFIVDEVNKFELG